MARAPYFIRQLKLDPSDPVSYFNTAFSKQKSKQLVNSIFKGGEGLSAEDAFRLDRELRATNPIAVLQERSRILNISNNLDSVRTYGWQAELYLPKTQTSDSDVILANDIPRLTLAIKSFEFPNYTQAKSDFTVFNTLISNYVPSQEKIFKFTFLDLLEGGDILSFLTASNNNYLNIFSTPPTIPGIFIKKYDTDGNIAGSIVFTECVLFGHKHGTLDYQAQGGMLEHTIDVRFESMLSMNASDSEQFDTLEKVKEAYKKQISAQRSAQKEQPEKITTTSERGWNNGNN